VLEVETEVVHAQIRRMLSSKTFESSETQRRLLQYLAEKALSGEADRLKEYIVGLEAFGKPSTYDPQEDSIVRTQTGRLRGKLREYYATEGKNDQVVVELPKGGFKLIVQTQPAVDSRLAHLATEALPESVSSTSKSSRPSTRLFPWVLSAILAIACVGLAYRLWTLRELDRVAQQKLRVPWPLSRVVNARRPTAIVGEDANLPRLRTLAGRSFQLAEYLSPDFPKPFLPPATNPLETRLIELLSRGSPFGNATVQNLRTIMTLSSALASNIVVRSPREVEARDFRDGNYILIGSPISNPWASVFEHFLNFREIDETPQHGNKYFANRDPKPGELSRYEGISTGAKNGIAYASLALVPNEQRSGSLLLLQGLQTEGTEAAGLFLSDVESCRKLREALVKLGADPEQADFEALIRANAVDGIPRDIAIIAVRLIR
jgi:hypothetical protein